MCVYKVKMLYAITYKGIQSSIKGNVHCLSCFSGCYYYSFHVMTMLLLKIMLSWGGCQKFMGPGAK